MTGTSLETYENIKLKITNRIGTLTLNRPDKLNAFAGRMRQEVADGVRELASRDDVRVLVITGAGRAFCAGADIAYMKDLLETGDTEAFTSLVEAGRNVVTLIRRTPKPVIASVNGPAAGGGANLALACDIRIAADNASIGQTFNRIGLHPDWGGTFFLPRLVGPAKAVELMFTGDMVKADEALRLGIFNKVVLAHRLDEETTDLAMTLAAKPPMPMALAKEAVYASESQTLDQMLDMELHHQLRCFVSDDAQEGLNAFLEKRKPNFRGT